MKKKFFDNGDNVRVKGQVNSPIMKVISNKRENGKFCGVECYWFDKNEIKHSDIFHSGDLEHYAPEVAIS